MALLCRLLVAACLVFAAGCGTVTSKYPIGTTAGIVPDPALLGTWRVYVDEKKTPGYFIHFISDKDSGAMLALSVAAPRDKDDGVSLSLITTAKLGDNHFLNAVPASLLCESVTKTCKPSQIQGTEITPVLYRFERPSLLVLLMMDSDKAAEAVNSGAIAGTVEKHESKDDKGNVNYSYQDVTFTAEPAALDAFMAKPETAKLFTPFMGLEKVE